MNAALECCMAQPFGSIPSLRSLSRQESLTPPASGRGYQRKSPRIDGRQINVYVIQHMPESSQPDE